MVLIDCVKWDEFGDLFVWKFLSEEFFIMIQFIVNESQEVLFYKEGKCMDIFGVGCHILFIKNIFILSKFINLFFGGEILFLVEVWFVNKVILLDIKWGTLMFIQLEDFEYQILIFVRVFGQFGL